MHDDSDDDQPKELDDHDLEAVQGGGGLRFGDYTVLAPGVQIVLDGRAISNAGD